MKKREKRGVSEVVTAILLILLAIAAILIVWYVYKKIVDRDTDAGLILSDLKIESVKSASAYGYEIKVKRNPGYGNVVKLKFVFYNDAGESEVYDYDYSINELDIKNIQTGTISISNPTKVEVYPVILTQKGNEILGPKKDEVDIKAEQLCTSNIECDNGLYCNGQETCNLVSGTCVAGIAVDCSGNNIAGIARCDNIPDNNPFTWDYRAAFSSSCVEATDSCTTGSSSITHTLIIGSCGVSCITNADCAAPNPICNINTHTCEPGGITVTEAGQIEWNRFTTYVKYKNSQLIIIGDMALTKRGYIEFDISTITNPNIIKVELRLNFQRPIQQTSFGCSIYSLETQPSTLVDNNANNQIIFIDAGNGNLYLSDNGFCRVLGWQTINLGPLAVTDLKNKLNNDWFGVGITTTAADESFIYSTESSYKPELIITYS